MTSEQALVALYMLADYRRVAEISRPPAPTFFHRHGVLTGITESSRKVSLRLIRLNHCLGCGGPLPADSTGDHVVAVANGGPPGPENFLNLCKACNSSKGVRDLLVWWQTKGREATELPADPLVIYCRLTFRHLLTRRLLGAAAPPELAWAVEAHIKTLPTSEHSRALWRRVQWVTGKTLDG